MKKLTAFVAVMLWGGGNALANHYSNSTTVEIPVKVTFIKANIVESVRELDFGIVSLYDMTPDSSNVLSLNTSNQISTSGDDIESVKGSHSAAKICYSVVTNTPVINEASIDLKDSHNNVVATVSPSELVKSNEDANKNCYLMGGTLRMAGKEIADGQTVHGSFTVLAQY